MNFILARLRGSNDEYAFEVPEYITKYITKDMIVLVETKDGLMSAYTTTDIFKCNGAKDIIINMNLRPVDDGIRYVVGFAHPCLYEDKLVKIYNKVLEIINSQNIRLSNEIAEIFYPNEDLPF